MASKPALWSDVQRDLEHARNHGGGAERTAVQLADPAYVIDTDTRLDREQAVGLKLHYCYSAMENVISTLVVAVDGDRPVGDNFHTKLIERAAAPVSGLRPAIISQETAQCLHLLKDFRHAVRHLYERDFDYRRAEPNVAVALRALDLLSADIYRFALTMGIIDPDQSN